VSEAGPVKVFARVDGEDMPKSWWIRLRNADQRLHAGNAFSYPRVVAQIDIDQDGNHEWLVKTYDLAGHGTNWQQLGLFVLNRWKRKLLQVTIPGGEPLAVRVGGISRMGEGARCDGDHLVILRTEAEDRQNVHWSFSERTYEITKGVAREVGLERGRLSLSDYNDPKLDPYYAVDCHGVAYP
jgi:hypothetical protein